MTVQEVISRVLKEQELLKTVDRDEAAKRIAKALEEAGFLKGAP